MCASDLCEPAAVALLKNLGWDPTSIDVLVFVTQSPDYISPATACVLHANLGLGTHCAAFDVNLGCSGWTYGLWMVSTLLAGGAGKRGLLLVGDCVSRTMCKSDRSVAPLFGDAGAATAIELDPDATDAVRTRHRRCRRSPPDGAGGWLSPAARTTRMPRSSWVRTATRVASRTPT